MGLFKSKEQKELDKLQKEEALKSYLKDWNKPKPEDVFMDAAVQHIDLFADERNNGLTLEKVEEIISIGKELGYVHTGE